MITFWLIAAVLIGIALAFVLPPLLQRQTAETAGGDNETNVEVYRDQLSELDADLQSGALSAEQYQQDRDEIERRLLSDVSDVPTIPDKASGSAHSNRQTVYVLALGIPVVAIGFYYLVGTPAAVSAPGAVFTRNAQAPFAGNRQSTLETAPAANDPMTRERMEANVAALAKRLDQNPGDLNGWKMLARSYSIMEKYTEASQAYERATALKSDDADLWADYALAKMMANGQQMQGEPLALVNRSLKLDPNNPKALQLAGGAAFQAKRYQEAVNYWERALKTLPADSEFTAPLKLKINEAKSLINK